MAVNYLASALAVCAPCFLNVRVSENSPNRWPTMFSVTNTGLKILPLCTLKVRPTKSGVIIERRDQVLIGCLDLVSFAFTIFSIRCPSTNGPFLIERPICLVLLHGAAITAHQDEALRIFSFNPVLVT